MKIIAKGNELSAEQLEKLTQGTVGQKLNIIVNEKWDGLSATAVFTAGNTSIDVVLTSNEITIPWELFRDKGNKIFVSLYGTTNDGNIVLTTNNLSLGIVIPSNIPSGTEGKDYSPSRVDQLQEVSLRAQRMAAVALGYAPKTPTVVDETPLCGSENLITSGGVQKVLSRGNLLDNWYFENPVNQKALSRYTINGYCIDRWKIYNANCEITSLGLELTPNLTGEHGLFHQPIEQSIVNSVGERSICFSVLLSTGKLVCGVINGFGWNTAYSDENIELYSTPTDLVICVKSSLPITVKAAKVELGDTQTLAHQENGVWVLNEIPDYGEELRKCQRYFCRVNVPTYARVGYGMGENSEALALTIPLPNLMRCTPAMTFSEGDWRIISPDGNTFYVDSMSSSALGEPVGLEAQILVHCSMAVPPQFVRLRNLSNYTQYLDFDANI